MLNEIYKKNVKIQFSHWSLTHYVKLSVRFGTCLPNPFTTAGVLNPPPLLPFTEHMLPPLNLGRHRECLNEQNTAEAPTEETRQVCLFLLGHSLWKPHVRSPATPRPTTEEMPRSWTCWSHRALNLWDGTSLRAELSLHTNSGMPTWASCCVRERNPPFMNCLLFVNGYIHYWAFVYVTGRMITTVL